MAKYKFIQDAGQMAGIYLLGGVFISRSEVKELLEELKEKIKEWENPSPNCFDPEYPPGSKYGLIKKENLI